ncbi:MAG: aminomethyl-transferring glycine dehydrogenase [Cryobacterium sp.]|nr:aminomethyl-transferring glycine dehydrogenase [Cryobacterium sp.]
MKAGDSLTGFAGRHIGTGPEAQSQMLQLLGYDSTDSLMAAAIPASIQLGEVTSKLPEAATETEALAELRELASKNRVLRSMIGLGYYDTFTPAVIKRNVLENPSWYTAYTPYQPEISQGRLEALINFQTMIAELTGLDTANASMLDESTAVVEGMLLARRASSVESNTFLVDQDSLPQTKALLEHRAAALGIQLHYTAYDQSPPPGDIDVFGAFIQYPGSSGRVWDPTEVIDAVKAQGGLVVVAADLLALTILKPPGEMGADIAVGTSQRFGVPMGFGGPHAGYLAVRTGLERQMPGRLVGVSKDADNQNAYRLTLQAREQHIRREKATSNICTAQVLLAVMAGMFAVYHGPVGIKVIAERVARSTRALAHAASEGGHTVQHGNYFDTLSLETVRSADDLVSRARDAGYLFFKVDDNHVQFSVDETTSNTDLQNLARVLGDESSESIEASQLDLETWLPGSLLRNSEFLTHQVFNSHHSESSMMRYLKSLADKDYALDRGMIPLGSCTMKLNAATEMEAVTWPEFGGVHPFAPAHDVAGYLELIAELQDWLAEVTGYDAVSLQPNAGSQGELAGLLAIRTYHLSRGDDHRDVCLIPSSAHGTNAASAVLAGMKVVVVACDELGNVDLADLREKIAEHASNLAALMITYPSTHGVYEQEIRAITDAVHEAGGQVYIDGANLNALLEFSRFGQFGGDVSHLNLHKTFCIPHGGGGPGVGPVAAKSHLAPFLPSHPLAQILPGSSDSEQGRPAHRNIVSAAPFGSPNILPITWAYIRMMGGDGLKRATASAVLAANYIAKQLEPHFPVLYTGKNGLVAHECILDLRPLTERTGVTVDDVAKRLIDYGFHAPTMSFPVPGTLMVEPTESEDLVELDRFIDAMVSIKSEAEKVADGTWSATDNPLVNAPHTTAILVEEQWSHPYSREVAVFPSKHSRSHKYWPPVRRIDQAWGDRNLFCACPPPESFA